MVDRQYSRNYRLSEMERERTAMATDPEWCGCCGIRTLACPNWRAKRYLYLTGAAEQRCAGSAMREEQYYVGPNLVS